MKILIDIGHPAHVHYFKNFIKIMESKGHSYLITARDKDVTLKLLDSYGFHYICTGKNLNGVLGKAWSIIRNDFKILMASLKFKPDLFLSFNLPFPAHVGFILLKPVIGISDTEHARLNNIITNPFTHIILTSSSYYKNLGVKQIRFNSFIELAYLKPNYFKPDQSIIQRLNFYNHKKIVLFRYISWEAYHDIEQTGISDSIKLQLIKIFTQNGYNILISAEGALPSDLEQYRIKIEPEKMHDVLNVIDFFIGESGTMATEAALLGIPSIYVNSLDAGVFHEEVKYKLLYSYRNPNNLIKDISELLKNPNLKEIHQKNRETMLKDKIDVTAFLVWFIENYPESKKTMKKDSNYQYNFK